MSVDSIARFFLMSSEVAQTTIFLHEWQFRARKSEMACTFYCNCFVISSNALSLLAARRKKTPPPSAITEEGSAFSLLLCYAFFAAFCAFARRRKAAPIRMEIKDQKHPWDKGPTQGGVSRKRFRTNLLQPYSSMHQAYT